MRKAAATSQTHHGVRGLGIVVIFLPECLVSDPADSDHISPLIHDHAEQGPPRQAIVLILDDVLVFFHTVAGHRKPCCSQEPTGRMPIGTV